MAAARLRSCAYRVAHHNKHVKHERALVRAQQRVFSVIK